LGVAEDAISCGAKSDEEGFGGCILLPSCLRASGVLGSGSVLAPDGVWSVGLRTWKRFRTVNGKANFLCNLGYGDRSKLFPRNPRLEFDEACRVW
jgi:hypothetical protein